MRAAIRDQPLWYPKQSTAIAQKAARHKELAAKTLPDAQHVLHTQAHARNANPAAKAERDGLAAFLDQIDDIGVKAHRRHSHNDKELGKRLERRRDSRRQRKHSSNYTLQEQRTAQRTGRSF